MPADTSDLGLSFFLKGLAIESSTVRKNTRLYRADKRVRIIIIRGLKYPQICLCILLEPVLAQAN